jgi:predicted site-specific integrase-resolvase
MNEEAERYTMQAGDVAKRLNISRESVHNYAETGLLSFVARPRGRTTWKYFDPAEVEAFAQELGSKP